MKKKILFVINTMGRAGAERCLLNMLNRLDREKYEVSLFSVINWGELFAEVPESVTVLNRQPQVRSVLDGRAKMALARWILKNGLLGGRFFKDAGYLLRLAAYQCVHGGLDFKKLFWKQLSDCAPRLEERYDLAVAYIQGAATCYVMDHVNAGKKIAFLHNEFLDSGYCPALERANYERAEKIYCVSQSIRDHFAQVYPDLAERMEVFYNLLDCDQIRRDAARTEELSPAFTKRPGEIILLTAARLAPVKAYDLAVPALARVRALGYQVKWYVLGDGPEKERIRRLIHKHQLEDAFILLGAVENPYPYIAACDLYVQATRYEGCCTAISEAMVLGKPVLASACSGNVEQLHRYKAGRLVELNMEGIAGGIIWALECPDELGVDRIEQRELTGQDAMERFCASLETLPLTEKAFSRQ